MMTYVNAKNSNILLSCQMALGKWLSRVLRAWVKNTEEEQLFSYKKQDYDHQGKKTEIERLGEKQEMRTWLYGMAV